MALEDVLMGQMTRDAGVGPQRGPLEAQTLEHSGLKLRQG